MKQDHLWFDYKRSLLPGCVVTDLRGKAVSETCPVELTVHAREIHFGDTEGIPIPDHNDGNTDFL